MNHKVTIRQGSKNLQSHLQFDYVLSLKQTTAIFSSNKHRAQLT